MRLGWPEILLILVIVMIVFGVGKLPQIGSGFGKAIREFKKSQQEGDEEEKKRAASPGSNGAKPAAVATTASVVVEEPPVPGPADDLAATQARLAAAEARIKELEASKRKG